MPNRRWHDVHKGDKDEMTAGQGGKGKDMAPKGTYFDSPSFGARGNDPDSDLQGSETSHSPQHLRGGTKHLKHQHKANH